LGLPPKTVTIRRDCFSEEEDDFYQSLYTDIARKFNTYVEAGTVLHNYAHIFELLSRMRLAANHPELIRVNKRKDTLVCGICNDEVSHVTMM
jgi:DNA repair protein RAD16